MSGSGEDSAHSRAKAWLRRLLRNPANPHEAVALAVHALLLGHGFRDADVPSPDEHSPPDLRDDWGQGGYGGRYRHTRSSMTFEVRSTPLGNRLRVTGVHDATDTDAATLDLPVASYYETPTEENAHWTDGLRLLENAATLVLVQIAHRLVPDAAKEGYEAGSTPVGGASGSAASGNAGAGGAAAPRPAYPVYPVPAYGDDPLRIGPVRNPRAPGFPGMPGIPGMPRVPGMPGAESDMFGHDDLMPQIGRGPGLGRGGGMGGNLMGPNNFPGMPPRLGGRGGGRGGFAGPVPPGARYDPMGPGGIGPDNNIERPPEGDNPPGPPPGMYW